MARILVVDDRASNREYLVTLLGYSGHSVLQAGDGAEGLAVAGVERPDLVIADILMPTMDGFEFVRRLRLSPEIAGIPVIFYTAHYHEREARNLAQDCGVSQVLTKPAEPEDVIRAVEAALGGSPPPPVIGEAFEEQHVRLLTDAVASKVDELRSVNSRLNALIELSLRLGSERDPARLLQELAIAARDMLGARRSAVAVVDDSREGLRHFVTAGGNDGEIPPPSLPFRGAAAEIVADRRSLRLRAPFSIELGLPADLTPSRAFVGVPICSLSKVYGWLCLADKIGAEEFTPDDERVAGILAAKVGRIYENGSLYVGVLRHAEQLEQEIRERERIEAGLRQAEGALRESQELFRGFMEHSPALAFIRDADGRLLYANSAYERFFRQPLERLKGTSLAEILPPDLEQHVLQAYHTVLREGEPLEFPETIPDPDGKPHEFVFHLFPIVRPDGSGVIGGMVLDVSERRLLEDQLRQAQKLEAVGRLAGGVAHDFNNMLGVINGYASILQRRAQGDEGLTTGLSEILKAGERAAGLTRQLLAFSRKQVLEPKLLDLSATVCGMQTMLERILGEDVEIEVTAELGTGTVRADPGQVEQCLLNLGVNARDAMPLGGKITIEVSALELDEEYARHRVDVRPGSYVCLTVSDTGCGMPPEVQSRIFEPFFSTKGEAGTGLGLATLYGIVKQSEGHVAVESEPGRGTTFRLYFPRVEEAPKEERVRATPRVHGGSETVLLVEDEVQLRKLIRTVLELDGYHVLDAQDGNAALLLAESFEGPIHLLLTDVVMPGGVSGKEVAQRITALRPGIKTLYMSGYTDDAISQHGVLEPGIEFIHKPFATTALALKVREVLGK